MLHLVTYVAWRNRMAWWLKGDEIHTYPFGYSKLLSKLMIPQVRFFVLWVGGASKFFAWYQCVLTLSTLCFDSFVVYIIHSDNSVIEVCIGKAIRMSIVVMMWKMELAYLDDLWLLKRQTPLNSMGSLLSLSCCYCQFHVSNVWFSQSQ